MKKIISFIIVVIFTFNASLAQIKIPRPTSDFFVNDFANVISEEDEKAIFDMSKTLYENSGNSTQVVVVTINSLEGNSLEEFANRLFNTWGIGSRDKNDGVLLLLSVGDRQSRIEIGYGLEGILPDGKTGRIQDEYMIPYYKNNDFSNGLKSGCQAIIDVINGDLIIEGGQDNKFFGVIEVFLSSVIIISLGVIYFISEILEEKRNKKIFDKHFNARTSLDITDELKLKIEKVNKVFSKFYYSTVIIAFSSIFIVIKWFNSGVGFAVVIVLMVSPFFVSVINWFWLQFGIRYGKCKKCGNKKFIRAKYGDFVYSKCKECGATYFARVFEMTSSARRSSFGGGSSGGGFSGGGGRSGGGGSSRSF